MDTIAALTAPFARSIWITMLVVVVMSVAAIGIGVAFGLTLSGAIGLYFVVWWTALFAILPVRVKSQVEAGAVVLGTEPGAPDSPALYERAIWTTVAAAITFALVAILFPLAGL
jgi:predicted secreted protein